MPDATASSSIAAPTCGANEQGRFAETFYYGRGESRPLYPVFKTSVGVIGVDICYDRHFEGVVGALARAGARLIFSPAVTFGAKSRRLWELEFLVDAARHRVFIGGSNRRGSEKPAGRIRALRLRARDGARIRA